MTDVDAYLESRYRADAPASALESLIHRNGEDRLYTPREIAQQPFLWRETARRLRSQARSLGRFLEESGLFSAESRPTIVASGAGTSDYVGMSVCDLLRRRFSTPCWNWPTTRITAYPQIFLSPYQRHLILHFARSGDSPESRAVLEMCLRQSHAATRHVVITCNADGMLADIARDHPARVYLIVLPEACNDRGLAMTSSFTNMIVTAQGLGYLKEMDFFLDLIERVASAGELLLKEHVDTVANLALPSLHRAYYLGNADLLGAATESALKVQELTVGAVTAAGEDTLGFRHGPVSGVDERSLVCFYLNTDPFARRYELDVLEQYLPAFAEMGAETVVVSDRRPSGDWDGATWICYDEKARWDVPTLHQVNVAVLFGQLFGMFASIGSGLNVDEPSGPGALYNRTVRCVKLYEYGRTGNT